MGYLPEHQRGTVVMRRIQLSGHIYNYNLKKPHLDWRCVSNIFTNQRAANATRPISVQVGAMKKWGWVFAGCRFLVLQTNTDATIMIHQNHLVKAKHILGYEDLWIWGSPIDVAS